LNELDLDEARIARLRALGTLTRHPDTLDPSEASARLKDADVAVIDGFKLPVTRFLIESGATCSSSC
jgi:hypothetical protein